MGKESFNEGNGNWGREREEQFSKVVLHEIYSISTLAAKAPFILNGAAAVAVIGAAGISDSKGLPNWLSLPLTMFLIGVVVAGLTLLPMYLGHRKEWEESMLRLDLSFKSASRGIPNIIWKWSYPIAWWMMLASYTFFVIGSVSALVCN